MELVLKLHRPNFRSLLQLLGLLILQRISSSSCSSNYTVFHNTSFSFPNFNSNNRDIVYEGDAFVSGGALQPTKNQLDSRVDYSVGRATYAHAVRLWDRASRDLADFTASFSFEISFKANATFKGDGLAFFLAPNGSNLPPDSNGGNLGLISSITAPQDSLRTSFVAVEFDTFTNVYFDPVGDHVAIDVNSLRSNASAAWDSLKTNGKQLDALVDYDSVSRNLTVRVTDAGDDVNVLSPGLSLTIDLRDYLTEWVVVGFSAATGQQTEIHKILSWNFASSLRVTTNESAGEAISPTGGQVLTPNPESSGAEKRRTRLWTVLAICGGVFVCIGFSLGFICFFYCKKRNKTKRKENANIFQDEAIEIAAGPRKFSYNELRVATNNFTEEGLLGEGGFGRVYLGLLRETNTNVAVKRISQQSVQGMKEYISEVRTISRLRHKNLVQLVGWCHEEKQLLLVYEFMSNSSLDVHLFNESCSLTWRRRYRIALDLASALFYLQEECDHYVLHRDIKLSNILLTLNFGAKLGDFGLARLVEHGKFTQTTEVLLGTEGYMAPEYSDSKRASKESDIYSFGVVLSQLACGKRAIGQVNGSKVKLVDWLWGLYGNGRGNILGAADPRLQGNYDEEQMERLMVVGLACAHPNYLYRPSIRDAADMLTFKAPLPSEMSVPRHNIMTIQEANYEVSNFVDSVTSDSTRTRTRSSGAASSNSTSSRAATKASTLKSDHNKQLN